MCAVYVCVYFMYLLLCIFHIQIFMCVQVWFYYIYYLYRLYVFIYRYFLCTCLSLCIMCNPYVFLFLDCIHVMYVYTIFLCYYINISYALCDFRGFCVSIFCALSVLYALSTRMYIYVHVSSVYLFMCIIWVIFCVNCMCVYRMLCI